MATVQELKRVTEESSSKFAQVGSIRIHYNVLGTGDPPILCIHGGGPGATGWSNFRGNIQDLARDRRMVLIDMPNYGMSDDVDPPAERLTWSAKIVKDFLDLLKIPVVDLIGNSMGGQVGVKFAIDYPDRIKHLVTIGSQPTYAIAIQSMPLDFSVRSRELYEGEGPTLEKMRSMIKSLVYDFSIVDEEMVRERYQYASSPKQIERQRRARSTAARPQDLYFELERNKVPTLIVFGQEDKGGALETGLLQLRRFQNARMHIFQRCGHWAQVEKREEFDRLVLEFFKT